MSKAVYSDLDFQSVNRITGLPPATAAGQAVPFEQLNSAIEGLNWKDSVRVSAPGNVNLAAPGANIDGVAMAVADRFLAPNQTTGSQNGIYIFNGAAVAATRALDMNSAPEVEQAITTVEEGTSAGATFRQTQVNVTLDTTALAFTSFGSGAATASETVAGVTEKATAAELEAGTAGNLFASPEYLAGWTGRHRGVAQNIGDGSATSFNIDHNFNTFDVAVDVVKTTGNRDSILCDVLRPTVNRVTVIVSPAPAANALRALITKVA